MQARSAELGQIDPQHVVTASAPQQAPTPPRPRPSSRARQSIVRAALKRVLLLPQVASDCPDLALLRHAEDAGLSLLCDVIERARANPAITTGALLEAYRGEKYERGLTELLTTPLELDDESESVNFHAAIEKLLARERQNNARQTTKSEFQRRTEDPGTAENQ